MKIVAVQTSPVSGDNDGEVHEEYPIPEKSYSVGITIVSGCDSELRRGLIERIAAESNAGRLVIVTSGGIVSTEEPDRKLCKATLADEPREGSEQVHDTISAKPMLEENQSGLNGYETRPSGLFDDSEAEHKPTAGLEGWISCSSTDEMAEVIAKLATSRECDYIIAEGSTDANMEPQDFAQLFRSRGGASLRVDTLVSVVDGKTLLQDLAAESSSETEEEMQSQSSQSEETSASHSSSSSTERIHDFADTRPMAVVSLVENANVVVLKQLPNSSGSEEIAKVEELVNVLNGAADIISVNDKQLPIDKLVNTNAYDHESVLFGATWKRVLLATRNAALGVPRSALPKSVKDASFVYRAKRPFHPTRLYEHFKAVATFAGVIRSTGRIWLATRMLAPLEWNQAGLSATLRVGKRFWAAVPEAEWPKDEAQREKIIRDWGTQYGDRETEIVFVGKGIDKPRLQGLLDGCLLQDEEMVFNNLWENFDDPFVEWVPLIEEDDEENVEKDTLPQEEEPNELISPEEELKTSDSPKKFSQESEKGTVEAAARNSNPEPSELTMLEENVRQDGASLKEKQQTVERDLADIKTLAEPKSSDPMKSSDAYSDTYNDANGGQIDDDSLTEEVMNRISALDLLEKGFDAENTSGLQPLPKDVGNYDEDGVIIASWDGDVADGILKQMPKHGLPVTIVTGFLGSGKTTLLNYILKEDHGLKIAVLVNEFGEIDIDNQLVEKGDWTSKDEVMELANGCICCSINDSFVNAVSKILERADDVDYLIVETTGLADPVPVINSLMVSEIADHVRVDGILTLVDADNFDPKSLRSEAVVSQIMTADTILLSKTDVASAQRIEQTIQYIKSVRPAARILKSQRGRVPINMILDVGVRVADSPAHLNPVNAGVEERDVTSNVEESNPLEKDSLEAGNDGQEPHYRDHDHEHSGDHNHEHNHVCGPDCDHESHEHQNQNHLEADGFVTTSFKSDRSLDPELFMNNFLQKLPNGVFRAKGLLNFHGFSGRYIFQLSGRRYQFEEDEWPEDMEPGNQLVIIGRDLDLEKLKRTLEECVVSG